MCFRILNFVPLWRRHSLISIFVSPFFSSRTSKGFHLSGEVWTFPPILSDANKSRSSTQSNQHGSVPLLPPYPSQNNLNIIHQNANNNNANNNNVNVGVYERNINADPGVQFAGEENKKFKVSVSFDRWADRRCLNNFLGFMRTPRQPIGNSFEVLLACWESLWITSRRIEFQ